VAPLPQANELSAGLHRIKYHLNPHYCRSKSQGRKDLRQSDKTVQTPRSSVLLRRIIPYFGRPGSIRLTRQLAPGAPACV